MNPQEQNQKKQQDLAPSDKISLKSLRGSKPALRFRQGGFGISTKFLIVFVVFGGVAFLGYQLYTFASTKQGITLRSVFSVNEYNPNTLRSLVGHWTFDGDAITLGAQNKVKDVSGYGNIDGTLVYGTTTGAGRIGQAVDFDGVDDFIYINGSAGINNIAVDTSEGGSFAAWIKPDTDGLGDGTYGGVIMTKGAANGWWLSLSENPVNAIRWTRGCGANTLFRTSAANTIKNGEWTHVVVTTTGALTASTVKIYVNGVETSYYEGIDCTGSYDTDTGADLIIGANVGTNLFDGKIDDVRLYRKVLSQKEITELYQLGATSKVNESLNTVTSLQAGLQGYWTLDGRSIDLSQNTAEIIDDSGNGNNGDWVGHSSTTVVGKVGQGVSFSGTNQYIDFSNTTNLLRNVSGGTIAAWIKPTIVAGLERIAVDVTVGTNSNTRLSFSVKDTGVVSVIARAGDAETANVIDTVAGPITSDEWHHVVAIVDYANDTVRVYVDGVSYPMASTPAFTASATSDTSPNNVAIGSDGSLGVTGRYAGSIDDVRIYGRALSEKEAVDLYKLGATSKIGISQQAEPSLNSDLAAYWPFDGKYINLSQNTAEILDASGGGNTGDWVNHASSTAVGRIGQAIKFDGVDDYALTTLSSIDPSTQDFSLSVWLYVDELPASAGVIVSQQDGAGTGRNWLRVNSSGVLETQLNAGTIQTIPSGSPLTLRRWTHVVIVHRNTANQIEWFVDGTSAGTLSTVAPNSATGALLLGTSKTFANFFDGSMDDVRIYNRALSQKEVTQLYQYGK